MKNLVITDRGHYDTEENLAIHLEKTNRVFFNKRTEAEIRATVCGNCGNVTLQAKNCKELWETFSKSK